MSGLRNLHMTPLEFCKLHIPALERDEARHNVMLAALYAVVDGHSSDIITWPLGSPGECATMAPGKPLLLADVTEAQCHRLAEATAGLDYAGVVGPDQTSVWFAQRASELGVRFEKPIQQRIHSLTAPPKYPGAQGHARLVTVGDAGLLADWLTAFTHEATPFNAVPRRENLEVRAGEGRHFFWIVDDEPVSMAAIARRMRCAAAIAPVYTPSKHRGKGYAGSVTAAVVEQIFADGKTMACLYTDANNPISNQCYAKIGFVPVCSSLHIPRAKAKER
jgi:predicted GNAT family acetyltransferase